jgi:hypothetical protein
MMDGDQGGSPLDMKPASSDLSTLDPASCTVGAADGCCPLLRTGGSDPDCPKLGCAKLDRGTPILLDDAAMGVGLRGAGGVGLSWTGRELALAWTYVSADAKQYKIVFERRGGDGMLSYGLVSYEIPAGSTPPDIGPSSLYYEPARRSYLLGYTGPGYGAIALDGAGMPQWAGAVGAQHCSWPHIDVFSSGSRWLIGQDHSTCSGEF